jgi:SAM-dependent methyltransferase
VESVNFDRAAAYYDATRALPAAAMAAMAGLLAAELADRQPCLEIGVGTGRIALPLRARGIELAGLDISAAMLRQLLANALASDGPDGAAGTAAGDGAGGGLSMPVVQADATRLPFAARSFGSVLAVHVLHLIPEWRVAVDEAARVLRPGGALLASFPMYSRAVARANPENAANPQSAADPGSMAEAPGTAERDPAAIGLTRDRQAPWADVVRDAARRHGVIRVRIGARDPMTVATYLADRATARELDPVPVRASTTLGATLDHIERQLFSWTWPYTAEQASAVAAEVRDWAAAANVPLDTAHESESAVRWWAFELRS